MFGHPHMFKRSNWLGLLLFLLFSSLLSACGLEEPIFPTPPSQAEPADETVDQGSVPIGERNFGAYFKGGAWNHADQREELERTIGHRFDMVLWFTSFEDPFEAAPVEKILEGNRKPIVTWQPHDASLADIVAGKEDDYLRQWAKDTSALSGTLYIRPFPEMNGDWVPWSGDPELLKAAWIHIVDLFRAEGADNVQWVWCPNITDWPRTEENRFENYYPGDAYVDVLALDGFNWGTSRDNQIWRSFDEIFTEPYERITALGDQPLWLAEIASAEQGGDKAAWIEDMLSKTGYPQIDGIIWFNERKEADWRMQSTDRSLNAFKTWFEQSEALAQAAPTD